MENHESYHGCPWSPAVVTAVVIAWAIAVEITVLGYIVIVVTIAVVVTVDNRGGLHVDHRVDHRGYRHDDHQDTAWSNRRELHCWRRGHFPFLPGNACCDKVRGIAGLKGL